MKNLISGILAVALVAGPASAQTVPTAKLPQVTVKLNGASGGGGSGTGFVCDAGDLVCLFQAPAGYGVSIFSDAISLGLEDESLRLETDASGVLLYTKARTVGSTVLQHDKNYYASNETAEGAYAECDTAGGAVVLTLDAAVDFTGRLIRINRVGGNTCTVGVTTGQSLDGVTNGTTTIPSAGWKTFIQTGDTAWVTQSVYPVTGTLSGLTAPFIPVAASGTSIANSDLSYFVGKFDSAEPVNGRKLCFTDSQAPPNVYCLVTSDPTRLGGLAVTSGSAEGSAVAPITASLFRGDGAATNYVQVAGANLWAPGFLGRATLQLSGTNGEIVWNDRDAPDTQLVRDAAGQLGVYGTTTTYGQLNVGTIQQSYSKALVDATATDVVQVPVASNSYEGFTMDYTIFATDATDYQVRQGSVPVAVLNVGGTETCVFGTATEAVNASVGTLTVAFDCTAGTNTVMVRANADTSLASTTIFTIQQRINLTSGTAVLVPQ